MAAAAVPKPSAKWGCPSAYGTGGRSNLLHYGLLCSTSNQLAGMSNAPRPIQFYDPPPQPRLRQIPMYSPRGSLGLPAERSTLLAVMAFFAVACAGSPTNSHQWPIQIARLSIANSSVEAGVPIYVDAHLDAELSEVARAALLVSAGADTEHVALYPALCDIEGQIVVCGEVVFGVAMGERAQDYESTVRALGAVLAARQSPATSEWLGIARVPTGDEVRVRDALRRAGGIIDAHLNFVMQQRYIGNESAPPLARAAIRTAAGVARTGDGVLQVAPGGTVRIASAADPGVFALATVANTAQ